MNLGSMLKSYAKSFAEKGIPADVVRDILETVPMTTVETIAIESLVRIGLAREEAQRAVEIAKALKEGL